MPRGELRYIFRTSDLCELYQIAPRTLQRWKKDGIIDATSLKDLILMYNKRVVSGKIKPGGENGMREEKQRQDKETEEERILKEV